MFGGFIAGRTNAALALTDDEAGKIALAATNVAKFYDVPVSPQAQAWAALAFTIGGIYGAKIMALRMMQQVAPQ